MITAETRQFDEAKPGENPWAGNQPATCPWKNTSPEASGVVAPASIANQTSIAGNQPVLAEPAIPQQSSQKRTLREDDELVFMKRRRAYVQHFTAQDGSKQLNIYFGDNEISFEEIDLFGFGESLAMQVTFVANAATHWGNGYAWSKVCPLLQQLIDEGVLQYADSFGRDQESGARIDGARNSLLPPAPASQARTWFECEAITTELTGKPLELGYLELVVPIFRVAHLAMDAEQRQVGEANVFPKALRVEVATNWRTCIYSGSRFHAEVPMNVSALKSMRADWSQMMAVLASIRTAYLSRFPDAREGWTVGHLERLSTVVLALPTYQLMRAQNRVENGQLHPALSCLFRVTDGLRLTMHQMMFVPIGEPALSPDASMTSSEIFAYAERNYSFHSEHGVCAGPQVMIEEFLQVVIDGKAPRASFEREFDAPIQSALGSLDDAFDYAMYGLQNYAAVFSAWPVMTRAYESLYAIFETWAAEGSPEVLRYRDQLEAQIQRMRTRTYLATENWRAHREMAYSDMYRQCAHGLRAGGKNAPHSDRELGAMLADLPSVDEAVYLQLVDVIQNVFETDSSSDGAEIKKLALALLTYFRQNQAILRVASETQILLNGLLGRELPLRRFTAADIDIHNLLQQMEERTLPYLLDEIQDLLRVDISIDRDQIQIAHRTNDPMAKRSSVSSHSRSISLTE